MERSKLLAAGLLAAALLLGGALGGAGARWVGDDSCDRDRRRGADAYLERLEGELDLTAEQQARVRDVLARQRDEMSALWREVRPRADEIRTATRREVRALLTPDQQVRYAEFLERIDRKHERKKTK
ncbi:MAG: periplasmic heavy metal sensor [Gemmatimonadota bacterium]